MPTGKVKWFNEQKGFGFITPDDGSEQVFFHSSSIMGGYIALAKGEAVDYDKQQSDKGRRAASLHYTGPNADKVRKLAVTDKAHSAPAAQPKSSSERTKAVPPAAVHADKGRAARRQSDSPRRSSQAVPRAPASGSTRSGYIVLVCTLLLIGAYIASNWHDNPANRTSDSLQSPELDPPTEVGILEVSVPSGSVGDNYWVYVDGRLLSAPAGESNARSLRFSLPVDQHTLEVAFLSPGSGSFPFAITRKIVARVRASQTTEVDVAVPDDWSAVSPARAAVPCSNLPDVDRLQGGITEYLQDSVVVALHGVDTVPISRPNQDQLLGGVVVLRLPSVQGGVREFEGSQIRYMADAISYFHHLPHCSTYGFSRSSAEYEEVISFLDNDIESFRQLATSLGQYNDQ